MAKHHFTPARLAMNDLVSKCEGQPSNNHHVLIEVLITCSNAHVVARAVRTIKRDLGSHLIRIQHKNRFVAAHLLPLQGFLPSECLYYYHYHLQRTLGSEAQVWLATRKASPQLMKGGRL